MKTLLLLASSAAVLLSACIGPPKIDYSKIDSGCAQTCSANHSICMSGFKFFPLVAESQCNDAMEQCAKTCSPKSAVAIIATPVQSKTASQTAQPSATERLKELDALFKSGLINREEYDGKKQEILRAM